MKATIYNLQKGIITVVMVLVVSSVGSATTKVHETPSLTNRNNSGTPAANNEAISSTGALPNSTFEVNTRDLSEQIEDWMSNGSYWESDNTTDLSEKNLVSEIESWMSNGSYWAPIHHGKKASGRLEREIKSWMTNGSYWSPDRNSADPE